MVNQNKIWSLYMGSINWIGVALSAIGVVCALSGYNKWRWFWHLAKGVYLPDYLGENSTAFVYKVIGIATLAIGTDLILSSIFKFNLNSLLFAVCGFLSALIFAYLFSKFHNKPADSKR
jgi:membrane protein implicated in regulation of membrane protease activity